MSREDAERSDDELIADIRRALGATSQVEPVSPSPPAVVPEADVIPEQPERRIAEDALRVADQLLGQGGSAVSGSAARADGDLCLEVSGRRFGVTTDGLDLGRQPVSEGIVVADPRVSRRHARFVQAEGGIAVVDLGSTNGTVVVRGGERLPVGLEPIVLVLGDRVATLNDVPLAEVVAGFLG